MEKAHPFQAMFGSALQSSLVRALAATLLILAPGISTQSEEHVRIGDALRLIRPDGSTVAAQLVGLEMFGGPNRTGIPILVRALGKEDVPIGTEVWTVDAN